MATEIERKFLVCGDFKAEAQHSRRITQGYLCSVPERAVRVRIKGDKGFLTIKGIGNAAGTTRYEWEREIPADEARELLEICEPGVIDKTRYIVNVNGFTFEVDEFYGDNEGLVIAEVELPAEDTEFDKPAWLGEEVTGDVRYYNLMLMKEPYKTWND